MTKPKALYVHIPFCKNICHYCDFPKLQYFSNFAKPYLQELKKELVSYQINHTLDTIYVGGGTPTSLENDLFEELLILLKPYTKNVQEFTFEANPESLSKRKLELMKQYGVNRLSIGVESTDNNILKIMNRKHTFLDVINSIERARNVGFENINIDLILGLPNVSLKMLKADLENILVLHPEHISCYSLTVHPHTKFYIDHVIPLDDDQMRSQYDLVHQILTEKGYQHYEVSNFAKENKKSKHNLIYWSDEKYYGIGLGASGYIDNYRYTNTKSINEYLKGHYVFEKEIVSSEDDRKYFIMLNLRTSGGLDLDLYQSKFHRDLLLDYGSIIESNIKSGFLRLSEDQKFLIPTYEGMMILDQIILSLF